VDKPQALSEDIQKIKSSSKYMLGLLNDILDMAKIESGKMEIRKSRQSVGEIVEAITTMANPMFETKNINFYCNVDTRKYKNFFVNIDRLHLQQVIMNLLSNASKFTPSEGRVELLLKILDRTEKTINLEIVVKDTGSGMTKEFQKVMFDSFTQDVNSVNKVGTGLGLS
ncbi:MAG: HAMP domain-containing histidine kinase, partial [Treponemataceae bacterium]|nr:HAMP domain-containing histidine kinase [Treponemataceae bacterium]